MEEDETPKFITEQIAEQFNALSFTKTGGNEHYASLNADDLQWRKTTVESFLSHNNIEEPDLSPTKHSKSLIDETVAKYDSMLEILMEQPNRSPEDEILIDKIINKTGELFRYEELILAIGSAAIGDFESHRQQASELSMELIGGINQPAFDTLLNELIELAEHSEQPYAKELLQMVGRRPSPENGNEKIELKSETREAIGQDLLSLYPGLGELLLEPDNGPVTTEQAVLLFEQIEQIADLEGWKVELSEGRAAETSSTEKKITIGKSHPDFKNRRAAIAVGFHEATHASRSEGIVLPDTLDFEEGFATRLQQVISGEKRTPGVQYYLSIGLQIGADRDGQARSYRDTFEILWRREALLMEQAGKEVDIDSARVKAQQQVTRTRRGGAVDSRDASYFVGAQKAAEWLNTIVELPIVERRRQLARALSNKYDPTIPEQAAFIEKNA